MTSHLERGKKTVLGRSSTVVQTLVPIGVTVAEIARGPSYTKIQTYQMILYDKTLVFVV